jgi:hypothetical protein
MVIAMPRPSLTPRERTLLSTHWIRGWVGLTAGLDTETRGKILYLCQGLIACSCTLVNLPAVVGGLQSHSSVKSSPLPHLMDGCSGNGNGVSTQQEPSQEVLRLKGPKELALHYWCPDLDCWDYNLHKGYK